MRPGLAVVCAASLMLGAACGNDAAPTGQEEAALRTLVDADLSGGEQSCLLAGLADLGVDIATVADGELTAAQDTEVLAMTLECIEDLGTNSTFVEAFIAGAAAEGVELDVDEARCAIAAAGDVDPSDAIAACLGSADGPGSGDYGDDEILDLLWDRCGAGNNQACDELYLTSPLSSGYEDYARTCGGRLPDSLGAECFDELG